MALPVMPLVALQGNVPSYAQLHAIGQGAQRLGLAQQQMGLQRESLGMRREELGLERQRLLETQKAKRREMIMGEVASIIAVPESQWKSAYEASRSRISQSDPELASELPPVYSADVANKIKMLAAQFKISAPNGDKTASIKEYEYAKQSGYGGSYMDFTTATSKGELPSNVQEWQFYSTLSPEHQEAYLTMKRANRPVDIGGSMVVPSQTRPGQAVGEIPKTVPPEQEPGLKKAQAAARVEGEREGELPLLQSKAQLAMEDLDRQQDVVLSDIDRALEKAGTFTTGFLGSATSKIPGTDAYDLSQIIDGIKANVGFDKLQAMREASKTGGALGQVSERENLLLQRVLGSLEQSQSEAQFRQNLNRLKAIIREGRIARREAHARDFGQPVRERVWTPERVMIAPIDDVRRYVEGLDDAAVVSQEMSAALEARLRGE